MDEETITISEVMELIKNNAQEPEKSLFIKPDSLRDKFTTLLEKIDKDFFENLFKVDYIEKEKNRYYITDDQFNVIFLILLLETYEDTKGLLLELNYKKNKIDSKNKAIKKLYEKSMKLRNNKKNKEEHAELLEKIIKESFQLQKLMNEYSEIISEIKKYDYERLKKYESKLKRIRSGSIINQYKDYIGFMTMEKEVKSYLSQIFEHISSYTPEVAQEIIEELKEEELTIINVKKKLMEIRMSHSEQIEKENHELIKLVESLELNEKQYNE
jgi:hypothetical protein